MTEPARLARWISILAHPFVMIVLMVGGATARTGDGNKAARAVAIVALFAIVPVALLMARQLRRGAWQTADASRVVERPALYAVGISGIIGLVLFLAWNDSSAFLFRGAMITLCLLIACAVTTRWIKVSLHLTAASFTATALILLPSMIGWIVGAILPLLWWSRLALRRHTHLEMAVGSLFGIASGLAFRFW